MIDFESALVWFDCERCHASGIAQPSGFCEDCSGGGEWAFDVSCLFANLAVAGALCDSFRLGLHAGIDADEYGATIRDVLDLPEPFFPGHALPSQPNTKGDGG